MISLSASTLVDLWDRSERLTLSRRGTLLTELVTGLPADELLDAPLWFLDMKTLDLRVALFGTTLRCGTRCQGCGHYLEFSLDADDIAPASLRAASNDYVAAGDPFLCARDGWEINARLPRATDIEACSGMNEPSVARVELLRRCVLAVNHDGAPWTDPLPDGIEAWLETELEQRDPVGPISLELDCDSCGSTHPARLDMARFVLAEIRVLVNRLMDDIHVIASSYGWTEDRILSLTPARRHNYVRLITKC